MTDGELIARLRKADEYEPLGHDGWEAADRIEALVKQLAEADALIEAQAKDHASNNIRLAETAHRAERLEAALVQSRGLYQVTHIHAAIDAALKGADHDRA